MFRGGTPAAVSRATVVSTTAVGPLTYARCPDQSACRVTASATVSASAS